MNVKYWTGAMAAIVLILAIMVIFSFRIPDEPYVELYFDNPSSLPSEIEIGKIYDFSFVIRNEENKKSEYSYSVNVELDDAVATGMAGIIILKDGEKSVQRSSFIAKEPFEQGKVTIKLQNRTEQIFFWVSPIG